MTYKILKHLAISNQQKSKYSDTAHFESYGSDFAPALPYSSIKITRITFIKHFKLIFWPMLCSEFIIFSRTCIGNILTTIKSEKIVKYF